MTETPPEHELTADEAEAIADGKNLPWTGTFTHPEHGELTFKGWLPTSRQLMAHSIEMDNRLATLEGEARGATMVLVAALAGLHVPIEEDNPARGILLELPVIGEERQEEDDGGKVTIVQTFYAPDDDHHINFIVDVWTEYSTWRQKVLMGADAVKGPSGATAGPD